jgi:ATP-binding cassette subfamily G (WHITE) protein 2 (SNQ2)
MFRQSKTYHWIAFIGAQTVSEIPYLIICATLYFACWYFTAGFPVTASVSGHVYLQMICEYLRSQHFLNLFNDVCLVYEFLYTSIGQGIAAYAPNEYSAAIMNPIIIGAGLISFCGVVVPYDQITAFWRYWIYWLDPFNYLVGGLLGEVLWDVKVHCKASELVQLSIPDGQTCGEYMSDFLSTASGYVLDSNSTSSCQYCAYTTGADYAKTLNLNAKYYSWRDVSFLTFVMIYNGSLLTSVV